MIMIIVKLIVCKHMKTISSKMKLQSLIEKKIKNQFVNQ